MKDYIISYTHNLGSATLHCYSWEVGAILGKIYALAMQGHQFSNLAVRSL